MTKPRRAGVIGAVHRKVFGLPPGGMRYTVERGLRVPTADGAHLLTDVYAPVGEPHGTVLIRTPYGRGLPESLFHGRAFADHGYQVVVQSVRGTGGSTGAFRPMAQEASDAQDTVAWLRTQPWFTGRLATLGGSYLGWTQWALLRDPPPELRASVVVVGPHDFARALRGTGSFALADFLGWSATIQARGLPALLAARRRVKAALREPTAEAAALGIGAPWFTGWVSHTDLDDPFWTDYDATAALATTRTPTLLIGGWHDVFVDQTIEQFQALEERGVDVAMTIGPWTHLDTTFKAARVTDSEALSWFDQHLAGTASTRPAPVHSYLTGAGVWRTLSSWPPKTGEHTLALHGSGQLREEPAEDPGTVEFAYDPADPTPALGGRHMSAKAGRQDNRPLESRDDVVTFTSAPLDADLDVVGAPHLELRMTVESAAQPSLFVRLCDVDDRGRSWNVTEVFTTTSGSVSLRLGACAHRFLAGHRVRLQISGGAYPRFTRNSAPARYTLVCADSSLSLPVEPASTKESA
ncbi:hydrolase [Amycolatopsis mediterranei S699]|uniref:Hydrolase n=2 Tax=Amycolatopsis mediterranei TaxID=33910 RepID=A0A0H3DB17_AMYMU|nr:CocE/NonD family hydrolase [Amycolatopsis mediterranei]ADJ48210.1 hydrolase [Amycolatopsis mediterranei U32]AEK45116.1 hydrolase [Amycolatopsis mediterranei S699]AFO79921.1 hydrolase [Amycolatopsis mediterranei S699]AGT87049.1 hydrolase [Amycolatopsis mediterranei RB]KDO10696.1 hydrolase [Amycolatopsis mediterranei]